MAVAVALGSGLALGVVYGVTLMVGGAIWDRVNSPKRRPESR